MKTFKFVAILKQEHEATMVKHWIICLDCYEQDRWQTKIKTKEHIMKNGLSNGSTKLVSKQNDNHLADHLEENTQGISNWKSKKYKW